MAVSTEKIKEIISDQGLAFRERARTIHTTCPRCGEDDKLSISKRGGATICYRGRCGFKGWFDDWLAETAKISRQEAKRIIADHGKPRTPEDYVLGNIEDKEVEEYRDTIKPVTWPAPGCFPLDFSESSKGRAYLEGRGIPVDVAVQYGIMFNIITDRVVMPIMVGETCYGWQARATFNVDKNFRMLNNEGYSRGSAVMFSNRLLDSEHAILCEGPFDAMKFHLCGGNVSTLGSAVTDEQVAHVMEYGVTKVYLAMDPDEGGRIAQASLVERIGTGRARIFVVDVPPSAVERCQLVGKKADFGECSFQECKQAFENAREVDAYMIL